MSTERTAKKAARQSVRRHAANKSVLTSLKTYVKKAEALIAGGKLAEAEPAVFRAAEALDRASQKRVIHKNNAARRKSRLMHKYQSAKVAASAN